VHSQRYNYSAERFDTFGTSWTVSFHPIGVSNTVHSRNEPACSILFYPDIAKGGRLHFTRLDPSSWMISLTDEYTVALGVTALAAYVVSRFLIPPSLVHPLLLGRQSHVAAVRKENESSVYTNYGVGSSPVMSILYLLPGCSNILLQLPVAPGRGVSTQLHLLKLDSTNGNTERWLWDRKVRLLNAQLSFLEE
jgi:hypothetical protein